MVKSKEKRPVEMGQLCFAFKDASQKVNQFMDNFHARPARPARLAHDPRGTARTTRVGRAAGKALVPGTAASGVSGGDVRKKAKSTTTNWERNESKGAARDSKFVVFRIRCRVLGAAGEGVQGKRYEMRVRQCFDDWPKQSRCSHFHLWQ